MKDTIALRARPRIPDPEPRKRTEPGSSPGIVARLTRSSGAAHRVFAVRPRDLRVAANTRLVPHESHPRANVGVRRVPCQRRCHPCASTPDQDAEPRRCESERRQGDYDDPNGPSPTLHQSRTGLLPNAHGLSPRLKDPGPFGARPCASIIAARGGARPSDQPTLIRGGRRVNCTEYRLDAGPTEVRKGKSKPNVKCADYCRVTICSMAATVVARDQTQIFSGCDTSGDERHAS